jgi:signal transduction histidine kinase/CheY-like chemotaxis protein
MEYRCRHKDGRWVEFEAMGLTYTCADGQRRFLAVSRDVTEKRKAERAHHELERSLQQSQKLESLGVLAGGIAHDFNNFLTPILGSAGLALRDLPEDSPVRAHLETIQRATRRAAALTNQMLTYAGQSPMRIEPIDLSQLVNEMWELVSASVSGSATLDLHLSSDLPSVQGEAAQLGQIILNLITNAAESLTEDGGRIGVRTGQIELERTPHEALFAETMTPGRHVYFEVTDTGCGMDPETISRIFDPFFTTKFTGRGLGLAAVAGIVRSHGGAIEVDSSTERGTRFRVLLPAVEGIRAPAPRVPTPIEEWHTTGVALVIDDDDGVRELSEEVLRRVGMTVLTAADGHEGLKLFGIHADTIRIVLLDRTMPELSGADTFEAIRALQPDAKILLVSGYSEARATAELSGPALDGFLQKPFMPETLMTRVREVLESPAARRRATSSVGPGGEESSS